MIIDLKQTQKAVKLDITLDSETTPEDIQAAVQMAYNEIYAAGMFPVAIVTPEEHHEYAWVAMKATNRIFVTNPGGMPLQGVVHNRNGVAHSISICSDNRLTDAIYVFCAPFTPFIHYGIEWPSTMENENDQN